MLFPSTLGDVASHWSFRLPKASERSWEDLKDKYMEGRQLLKSVGTLDHIKQKKMIRVWVPSTLGSIWNW